MLSWYEDIQLDDGAVVLKETTPLSLHGSATKARTETPPSQQVTTARRSRGPKSGGRASSRARGQAQATRGTPEPISPTTP
jgi:hypothetical protein